LNTALSAIEIYNKPDFKDREEVFAILMVTAWESLLKAKLLKDNGNKLTSLYVKDGSRYKKKRSGARWTIGIDEALSRCDVPEVVRRNLLHLVDIRDAAVHLTAQSPSLPYLVFTLGSASVHNYARLIREWFDVGLTDYNFYILPLGFSYPFRSISAVDIRKEPDDIAAIIREVSRSQGDTEQTEGYHFLCEIRTVLVSAKKLIEAPPDITAAIDPSAPDAAIVRRDVNYLDIYPFTYRDVFDRVKSALPSINRRQLSQFLNTHIKGNPTYSRFVFHSKRHESDGPCPSTAVIYNQSAVDLVIHELDG
jgi:hypothetical protein